MHLELPFSCCDRVPKFNGFYRPLAAVGLRELFSDFNDEDNVSVYDYLTSGYPWKYPNRSLLSMDWGGMGGARLPTDELAEIVADNSDWDGDWPRLVRSREGKLRLLREYGAAVVT